MKLSELEGEKALDVLADLIEPATEIMSDQEMVGFLRSRQMPKAAKVAIKNHKKAVIEILAVLDDKDPAEYKPKFVTFPVKLLELLNDPELVNLFTLQGQTETSSGSATENTEESAQ